MKRFISVVLIFAVLCSMTYSVQAAEIQNKSKNYAISENLMQYLKTNNHGLLCRNKNYGYMNFVNGVRSNEWTMYFFEMANLFAETGVEPDKEKYMEVLVNIMATYEMDNASAIAEQQKQDNLKSVKDYAIDIAGIVSNSVSLSAKGDIEEWLSIAISGVNNLAVNIDNWIEAFSNLETIVQDYSQYDNFLKTIEANADGELKDAASTLRTSMERAMEIKLNTYNEISNENFKNYEKYFFEDVFFTALKQTNDYTANANFKFLVDCGDKVVSTITTLKSSWELGAGIGKLIGNVVVGGEDLANRTMEMRALSDISMILQKELMEVGGEFAENFSSAKSDELAKMYVAYSDFLIGCRIRGEYCLYSVIASDAGLLSWANKKDAQEAKDWYDRQSSNIIEIRDAVQKVMIIEQNELVSEAYSNTIEFNAYGEKQQFVYQIPQINIETAQAQDLNLKIYNELEKYVLEAEKISSEKLDDLPECSGLSYTWEVYENILSIMIVGDMWPELSPYTTYWVYNIDIESGEEISKDRLFKLFDLSQDEYLELAKKAMAENWWTVYGEVIEREGLFESVKQQLSDTLSEDNVNEAMPYINRDGDLCAIYKMYAIAGAESYEQIINLSVATKSEFSLEDVYIEQAKALLQDNAVEEAVAVLDEGIKTCAEAAVLQEMKEYVAENVVVAKEYYYSDGELCWIIEYEYNQFGDESKKTYVKDGKINKWYEYQYDVQGNNIKYTTYSVDGTIEKYVESTYDIKGNLLEEYENKAGEKKRISERKYDENGNMIEYTRKNSVFRYEYDDVGNNIRGMLLLEDGTIEREWLNEFDGNGNKIKSTAHDENGKIESVSLYSYDENGRVIEEVSNGYGTVSIKEYSYDTWGNITEERMVNDYVDEIYKDTYEYEYQFIGSLDNATVSAIDDSAEKILKLANGDEISGATEVVTEYFVSGDEELINIPNDAIEFNGHKYYVYGNKMSWSDAKTYCEKQGGYLATITSQEEDSVLYDYITGQGYSSVYFGVTDEETEGIWKWVTGENLDYQNWKKGEPNNEGKKEHYGMYYSKNADGTWNDGNGKSGYFICEWNVS